MLPAPMGSLSERAQPVHAFPQDQREALYRAIYARRDVREFVPGVELDPSAIERMLQAAHHGPSVGFMQPWRFIRVRSPAMREAIAGCVETERQATADALGPRREAFLRLKVEGIRECSELLVVALKDDRASEIFGRRTLPSMDLASAACAIQNLWLAGRVEGIGVGWVSIFDPDELGRLLNLPRGAECIAILCLGQAERYDDRPRLETEGWRAREDLHELVFEERWPATR